MSAFVFLARGNKKSAL